MTYHERTRRAICAAIAAILLVPLAVACNPNAPWVPGVDGTVQVAR